MTEAMQQKLEAAKRLVGEMHSDRSGPIQNNIDALEELFSEVNNRIEQLYADRDEGTEEL